MTTARRLSFTETSEVSPFVQPVGVSTAHRRNPSASMVSIRPPSLIAGTAGYRALGQDATGAVPSLFQSAKLARFSWLRAMRWTVPILCLVALVIAGMEQASIISLNESLSAMRGTLRTERLVEYMRPQAYFCPLASAPRPSTPFSPGALSAYELLESTLDDFTLSIAYAHSACNQFRVKIQRTDRSVCFNAKDRKVSEDRATQEYIRTRLGPDTFQLRVDGAERLVVDTPSRFDSSECTYEFDFRLSTPGVIWFTAMRMYKDYDGFYELHGNQSNHLNPAIATILPRALQLNICSSTCTPHVSPIINSKPYVYDPMHVAVPEPKSMPACTGKDPIPGAYVASSLPSILYPPVPLPQSDSRPSAGLFDFVPTECTFQHDGLRFRNHDSCLEQERGILFIGDSHARAAYDALLHRLSGNDTVVQLSEKIPAKSADLGKLHLEFTWDPFLTSEIDCEVMRTFTSVIVSTGAHQACWACERTPTTALEVQLSTLFSSWALLGPKCLPPGAEPPKLIYMNSPAFWYPGSHYRLDCRTGPRLEYWNNVAGRLARESGWAVVDTFAHSRPFAIDTFMLDGVHYLKTDAIDPMADEIIEKLGICGNNPDRTRW